ncbi:hypothetical protein ABIF86_000376 [Bradyrhizobium japonicum]
MLARAEKATGVDALEMEVDDLKARKADADARIARPTQILKAFDRARFGPRSEKIGPATIDAGSRIARHALEAFSHNGCRVCWREATSVFRRSSIAWALTPRQAARSWALRNCSPSPIAASTAVAPNAPIPGIVISRRVTSSRSATDSISFVTSRIRSSRRRRSAKRSPTRRRITVDKSFPSSFKARGNLTRGRKPASD